MSTRPRGVGQVFVLLSWLAAASGLSAAMPLVISAGNADNQVVLRLTAPGSEMLVVRVDGIVYGTASLRGIDALVVNGDDGDDVLTVDFANGSPIPPGGLVFNGGGQATLDPGDVLVLKNESSYGLVFNFINSHDGSIELSLGAETSTIHYTGLEPISSTITADDVELNYSPSSEEITITASGMQTKVDSTEGESTTFNNPKASLTINAGDGNDTIEWIGSGAGFDAAVTLNGESGDDTILMRSNQGSKNYALNGGDGNDIIWLGNTGNTVDGISGPFTVDGGNNRATPTWSESVTAGALTVTATVPVGDTLTINDQGFANGFSYNLSATAFDAGALAVITSYAGIETVNVNAAQGSNVLNVVGTADNARTTVTSQGSADDVDVTTTGTSSILTVNAAGGADQVDVAVTGAGSVTVVNGGDSADGLTQVTSGAASGVALNGQAGADTIQIGSSGATSATLATGGTQPDVLTLANAGAASRAQLDGDAGNDNLTVQGSPASNQTQANGGTDNDTITIGSPANQLSNLLGELMIDGGGHAAAPTSSESVTAGALTVTATVPAGDVLNINDQGYASAAQYNLGATAFDRDTTVAQITSYTGIETVNVNAAQTSSDLNVTDTADNAKTTVTSQGSADDVDVTTTGTSSILNVNAAGGADQVDVAATGAGSVTVVNGGDGADGLTQVTSGAASGVALNGQAGADTIQIGSSGATSATLATGGTQPDVLTLANAGAASRAQLDGDAGNDNLTVQGSPASNQTQANGGTDNDTITIGSPANQLSNLLGELMIDGGGHAAAPTSSESVTAGALTVTATVPAGDVLNINDQGYASAAQYNLGATAFDRDTTVAQITSYTGIETVNVNAAQTSSDLNVTDTADNAKTTVTSQGSADDVDVTTTGTSSILNVNAAGEADQVDVAATGAGSVTVVNGGDGADGLTQVTSGAASGVALNGQAGADTIQIGSSGATSATLATGGTQPDVLTLANAGAASRAQLDGDAGNDSLTVQSSAASSQIHAHGGADAADALSYLGPAGALFPSDTTSGSIAASGPDTVTYTGIESLSGNFLLDYGDVPDPTYATLLSSNGARHAAAGGLRLGAFWDAESNGQPTASAQGDDIGGGDEDGVTFTLGPELGIDSVGANLEVFASGIGYLNAWIDFNADGDWSDPDEQVFANRVLAAGTNLRSFTAFSDAVPGPTFARFRFSTAGNVSVTGMASDGEVEDYQVTVRPPLDLDLFSRTESGSRTFWACNSISAGDVYVVSLGSDVTFRAANVVSLRNDLTVEDGGMFTVILGSVTGCLP